jgi:hypothetical protein
MGTLNTWLGDIGGTILGLELIVLLVLLTALNGALAFGLWWVLRKMNWVHGKVSWASGLVTRTVDKGANIAAEPVIRGTSLWRGGKAALNRATHWPRVAAPEARPAKQLPAGTSTKEAA